MNKPRKISAPRSVLAFLAFLALALSWSLGTPLLSAADEPEQSVKAAAAVRMEFSGREHVWNLGGWQGGYSTPDYLEVAYGLPHSLVKALAENDPQCYAFRVGTTPVCTVKANADKAALAGDTASSHMNYSPLYYLLVGWPSLFLHGDSALYGMRIASALITAALLAAAFVTTSRRRGVAAIGILAAATPAAIYFGSVVNPSGLEICSALLAWASFASLVHAEPGAPGLRRDRMLFATSAVLLILTRPLGSLWLAMIIVLVLVTATDLPGRVRELIRGRGAWWVGGAVAAALVATLAWDTTQNTMGIVPHTNSKFTFSMGVYLTLQATPNLISQMLGVVGWNDVHVPEATTLLWCGVVAALVLLAFALGNRRERLVLLATTVLVVVFPMAFEGYSGASYGVGWQGRYTLPLAVGMPILGAEILMRRLGTAPWSGASRALRSLANTLAGTLAIAYLFEVWWAWRRYAQGLSGKTIPTPAKWTPPIGWPAALGLAVLGCIGLVLLLRWTSAEVQGGDAPAVDADSDDDAGMLAQAAAEPAGESASTTSSSTSPSTSTSTSTLQRSIT